MRNIKQKFISLVIGGLAFYATTIPITPLAMWIKFAVFIIVTVIAYLWIKPKD